MDLSTWCYETDVLLLWLSPTKESQRRRAEVSEHIAELMKQTPALKGLSIALSGSFPTRVYLPDADIDLSFYLQDSGGTLPDDWVFLVNDSLVRQAAASVSRQEFEIRNVTFINGRVKVVNAFVGNLSVDISPSRPSALAAAWLVEQVKQRRQRLEPVIVVFVHTWLRWILIFSVPHNHYGIYFYLRF